MSLQYFAPGKLEELFPLMKGSYALLGGGTNLVFQMREGKKKPQTLLSLRKIPELSSIFRDEEGLHIGSMVSLSLLEWHPETSFLLAQALQKVSSRQISNQGTLGGNICSGSPAADAGVMLCALEAQVVLASPAGERRLPLREFYRNDKPLGEKCRFCRRCFGKTGLKEGEILREVIIPSPNLELFTAYVKLGQNKNPEIPVISVALAMGMKEGVCQKASLVLGAAAPNPLACPEADQCVQGKNLREIPAVLPRLAADIMEKLTYAGDIQSGGAYRRNLAGAAVRQAFMDIVDVRK